MWNTRAYLNRLVLQCVPPRVQVGVKSIVFIPHVMLTCINMAVQIKASHMMWLKLCKTSGDKVLTQIVAKFGLKGTRQMGVKNCGLYINLFVNFVEGY